MFASRISARSVPRGFVVIGHRERREFALFGQDHVAAALPDQLPPHLAERADDLASAQDGDFEATRR
jgi:hypothetical protein